MKRRFVWVDAIDDEIDIPPGGQVIEIEFHDVGGLGHRRTITGAWIALGDPLPAPVAN